MSSAPPTLRAVGLTDRGIVRDHNEDAFAALPEQNLVIVSDGMGGANAGGVASQIVTQVLPGLIAKRLARLLPSAAAEVSLAVRDAITDLGAQVRERSIGRAGVAGMGATVVLGLVHQKNLIVAHMGDSRAYLHRSGELRRLTQDHSVVELLVRRGELAPEEAKRHPARGRLSRFVGMEGIVYPDVESLPLVSGDRVLLCTDGLTGMVDDAEIAQILAGGGDLAPLCRSLVDAANAAGGRDNVTVLLAELV